LQELTQDRSKTHSIIRSGDSEIVNALTIDVEDYFHIHAFSKAVHREQWDSFVPRVEKNTLRILHIVDSCHSSNEKDSGTTATFFVLGWVAERFPSLIKEIAASGHEVACHGYWHECIFHQTKKQFEEDVRRAKGILEDIIGKPVIGYRAPTYSIKKETLWAVEILLSLGFRYDSSIFPVRHDAYGMPDAPRFPFFIDVNGDGPSFRELKGASHRESGKDNAKGLLEFPLTTARLFGGNIPIAGGGYFRLFPYSLTKTLLKRVNKQERKPFVFYIHPWEIDEKLPRVNGGHLLSNVRTYINLEKTETRLRNLLSWFSFSSVSRLIEKNRLLAG
jgi:polysaccharide deacetylase family protein (PEP-CTERM system associated)